MSYSNSDKQIKLEENQEINKNFLKNYKLWSTRLKLNNPITLTIYFLIFIIAVVSNIYIYGLENYLNATSYLTQILLLITGIFSLFMSNRIPKLFQELISKNYKLLLDPKTGSKKEYDRYVIFIQKRFKSKIGIYLPLILAIIYVIGFFFLSFLPQIISKEVIILNEIISLEGPKLYINFFEQILVMYLFFYWILLITSTLVLIIIIFSCLNRLGTSDYNLNVSFEELKIGGFEEIGKFIISISIPIILLSTFFSIIGLFLIFFIKNILSGYTYMIVSIIITIILVFLLYKNTLNIHHAIVNYKHKLKSKLLNDIKYFTNLIKDEIKDDKIYKYYKSIHYIQEHYKEIDKISDWPFNPTSIKKLLVTLGSSLFPFLLSFIGLG